MDREILSVSKFTQKFRSLVENNFTNVWITGEISNLNKNKNGHCFFSLKDDKAVIGCAIWSSIFSKIKYNLENGLSVIVHGRITVYEKGGNYNLIVDYIEPEGIGDLQREFLLRLEKLKNAGYFDSERKKEIPPYPETVGIVTSPTGAALQDILNIMKRRFSNVNIIVYPAKVQGSGADSEIAAMINIANELNIVDVLIIGRGGGSIEDLWPFNELTVADAIYNSKIPIISAVGHETDFTIADYVADLRAPTPSAAAEIVVDSKEDLIRKIEISRTRLGRKIDSLLILYKEKIKSFSEENLIKKLNRIIEQSRFRLEDYNNKLKTLSKDIVEKRKNKFLMLGEKLSLLDPLSILSRGYSISYKIDNETEKIIKNSNMISKNDSIKVKFAKGYSICKVEDCFD